MIDVPQAYEPDDDLATRGVLDYPTLSIKQACALAINSLMHKDSVLFYWVTNFILARGLHLEPLTTWGFRAKDDHHLAERSAHFQSALAARTNRTHGNGRTRQAGHRSDRSDDAAARAVSSGAQRRAQRKAHRGLRASSSGFAQRRDIATCSPLSSQARWDCHGDQAPTLTSEAARMIERQRLPNRRRSENFTFELGGLRFTATISRLADGRIAELFLNNHKAGNQIGHQREGRRHHPVVRAPAWSRRRRHQAGALSRHGRPSAQPHRRGARSACHKWLRADSERIDPQANLQRRQHAQRKLTERDDAAGRDAACPRKSMANPKASRHRRNEGAAAVRDHREEASRCAFTGKTEPVRVHRKKTVRATLWPLRPATAEG